MSRQCPEKVHWSPATDFWLVRTQQVNARSVPLDLSFWSFLTFFTYTLWYRRSIEASCVKTTWKYSKENWAGQLCYRSCSLVLDFYTKLYTNLAVFWKFNRLRGNEFKSVTQTRFVLVCEVTRYRLVQVRQIFQILLKSLPLACCSWVAQCKLSGEFKRLSIKWVCDERIMNWKQENWTCHVCMCLYLTGSYRSLSFFFFLLTVLLGTNACQTACSEDPSLAVLPHCGTSKLRLNWPTQRCMMIKVRHFQREF